MKLKLFIQADCLGTAHHDDLRRQGVEPGDPMLGWVCKEVNVPKHKVTESVRAAARFAAEAKVNETMILVAEAIQANGRIPVIDSFDGAFQGVPTKIIYLCGLQFPEGLLRCQFCGGQVAKVLRMEGDGGVTETVTLCDRCARDIGRVLGEEENEK